MEKEECKGQFAKNGRISVEEEEEEERNTHTDDSHFC